MYKTFSIGQEMAGDPQNLEDMLAIYIPLVVATPIVQVEPTMPTASAVPEER